VPSAANPIPEFENIANMAAADLITLPEFRDALNRYPALISSLTKPGIYLSST
jgi:hypothetical protein